MTCTICGESYEADTPQARARRTHCYREPCMREKRRRVDCRRRSSAGTCAVCGEESHPGRTCKEVAA